MLLSAAIAWIAGDAAGVTWMGATPGTWLAVWTTLLSRWMKRPHTNGTAMPAALTIVWAVFPLMIPSVAAALAAAPMVLVTKLIQVFGFTDNLP
jgi:hypothetical protein